MSLNSILPQPIYSNSAQEEFDVESALETVTNYVAQRNKSQPPCYGNRVGWVPRIDDDFADGGAYPEIPCVQFPYGIGKVKN
ncbi:hypothetical protein HZS_3435 [Henneguya salminicola]|nr:hypothetical protein HZS_3435 [Henneguya salminicola]